MTKAKLGSAIAILTLAACPAIAADMPVKSPRALVVESGSAYVWLDGSYEAVRLPGFGLGWHNTNAIPIATDAGLADRYNVRTHGWGITGGFGYLLPAGAGPFGSNARFEASASYNKTDASQSLGPTVLTNTNFMQLVSGTVQAILTACGVGCTTASNLTTDYGAWQVNGRFASDVRVGAVVVTPSLAVFFGQSRSDHDFNQRYFTFGALSTTYTADAKVDWTDIGIKAGLAAKVDVSSTVALGLSGNVGTAHRYASMSANDAFRDNIGNLLASSLITRSATTTPLLANAEARLTAKVTQTIVGKAFVGVNYDSRVPGVAAPSVDGNLLGVQTRNPAGIKFERETSWYAGGGLTVSFGDPVAAR